VLASTRTSSGPGLVALVVGTIAVDYVYLSQRTLPDEVPAARLLFLLVYQVYVVLSTGATAFTNYGDGHNDTKEAAIGAARARRDARTELSRYS
jgi:arabinogalactan oligomer/maltooligosaccharide transport system permease protein